jgi:hypothetical protein
MASGFAGLALKAAAVAAVLSFLFVPSLGRCRQPPPPPPSPPPPAPALLSPPPAPAPAPAQGPPVLCGDCYSHCLSTCDASANVACYEYCDDTNCDGCLSSFNDENCKASCCSRDVDDGTCSRDCKCGGADTARRACYGSCTQLSCDPCVEANASPAGRTATKTAPPPASRSEDRRISNCCFISPASS